MLNNTNTEEQLIQGILDHGPEILEHCITSADLKLYIDRINEEKLGYPIPPTEIDHRNWFIPRDYCPDLIAMLYDHCDTEEQRARVDQELQLFIEHDMYEVLHVMKYIVDTLRTNNIVWGVGRGSSVASYVLYLIGVHKIDSVKYKLPIEEFFKEKQNG